MKNKVKKFVYVLAVVFIFLGSAALIPASISINNSSVKLSQSEINGCETTTTRHTTTTVPATTTTVPATTTTVPATTTTVPATTTTVPATTTTVPATTTTVPATTTTVPATTTTVPATTTTTSVTTTTTPTPTVGSIQIVKIITAAQGSDTAFGFTIDPAINGQSEYFVNVPSGQTEGRLTIGNVPFGITYSIAETNIPADWTLFQSEGTSFTLNVSAAFATPAFWNAPPGAPSTTGTTPPGGVILVAAITTDPGAIEVAGIQEMPFTGQRDNLLRFGLGFVVIGIMMLILLPVFLRTGKHQIIK